ncbi:uncharacterized protein G2W53_037151 [Senna tora]|uniref:Uncharacterized protein n=1 Tax=Senna tora TaxID=362788 RepID=A0A834W6S3_9FABA|nr:uncharacterized protein G2W53_037151 [Senna tora]
MASNNQEKTENRERRRGPPPSKLIIQLPSTMEAEMTTSVHRTHCRSRKRRITLKICVRTTAIETHQQQQQRTKNGKEREKEEFHVQIGKMEGEHKIFWIHCFEDRIHGLRWCELNDESNGE